jgi:hypothetical protein
VGMRRIGSTQRAKQRAKTRSRNRPRKIRERASRDRRMIEVLKAGNLPYTPWVMSWLNVKLDKPSRSITQSDVEGILAHAHVEAAA